MDDPNASQGGSTTTPDSDEYSTPIPQGASAAPQNEYGTPLPQGSSVGTQQPPPQPDRHWYSPSTIEDVGKGFVKGAESTVAGLDDMASKIPVVGDWLTTPLVGQHAKQPGQTQAQASQQYRDTEHQRAQTHNTAQNIGYGGETLTEFVMGDEALKGLSMADKLATSSKIMKVIERSPRLMQALKFGATAAKASSELSPEEAAIIRQSPKLAKLVGLGLDAARAGAVQGAQTTIRTGGNVKQGAVDAAGTAATAGVLGGVLGAAGHVMGNGSKAAQTVADMTGIAKEAPSQAAVEGQVSDAVHGAFNGENATLQNNLDDATSQIGMFGEGAPQQSAITTAAQQYAKQGENAVHAAYQGGLDQLTQMSGDATVPYEGSPLHKAATELTQATPQTAGPLDEAFNIRQPASPRANAILDRLTNLGGEPEETQPEKWVDHNGVEHTEPAGESQEAPSTDLNMQHLVARRHTLSRIVRDLNPTSPDYQADKAVYSKLLEGVDDTIGQLSDQVHQGPLAEGEQSHGRQLFDQMNQQYREGIRPFQNKDVQNILKGNLNDVAKSIMGGQTSIKDIADVKQALGPQNFSTVSRASLQNIVQSSMNDSGDVDYKGLFKKFGKIDPNVRSAMFGQQGEQLADALKVATDASGAQTEIGKQITGMLGNGDIDSILKDPKRAQDIANAVGPDGMKAIGRSVIENQIQKASTTLDAKTGEIKPTNFDPDKVLDWWMGMKDNPEVRDSFFNVDKDTAKQYNEMMSDLANASSVKKLVKYGVLPVTLGTAGVVHGPGAALMGALAGLGTEAGFGRARDILDSIANRPATWKVISGVTKPLGAAANAANKAPVRNAAAKTIYSGVKAALGGDDDRQTQQDKVVVPEDKSRGVGQVKLPVLVPQQ
jgi:hypothetical protein